MAQHGTVVSTSAAKGLVELVTTGPKHNFNEHVTGGHWFWVTLMFSSVASLLLQLLWPIRLAM